LKIVKKKVLKITKNKQNENMLPTTGEGKKDKTFLPQQQPFRRPLYGDYRGIYRTRAQQFVYDRSFVWAWNFYSNIDGAIEVITTSKMVLFPFLPFSLAEQNKKSCSKQKMRICQADC